MVVFTCNHCGESLQKSKVEKHYSSKCSRNPKYLTCVDCLKDYKNEEYTSHNKCLSEQQRYSAKGTPTSNFIKKGESKQEKWIESVNEYLATAKNIQPNSRELLSNLCELSNIPRKKQPFFNMIENTYRYNRKMLNATADVWNILEEIKTKTFATQSNQSKPNPENGTPNKESKEMANNKRKNDDNATSDEKSNDENGVPQKKMKKSKNDKQAESTENGNANNHKVEEVSISVNNEGKESNKFSFEDKILSILNKKKSISLQKLRKKVLNAYIKYLELDTREPTAKQLKKFNKRLKKIENVTIEDETVTLKE